MIIQILKLVIYAVLSYVILIFPLFIKVKIEIIEKTKINLQVLFFNLIIKRSYIRIEGVGVRIYNKKNIKTIKIEEIKSSNKKIKLLKDKAIYKIKIKNQLKNEINSFTLFYIIIIKELINYLKYKKNINTKLSISTNNIREKLSIIVSISYTIIGILSICIKIITGKLDYGKKQ